MAMTRERETSKLALFDIDGVLVRQSTERAFWRYLLRVGEQRPRQLLTYALDLIRYLPSSGIHAPKVNKSYLAGLDCAHVAALGEQFIDLWVDDNWNEAAIERLFAHHEHGDTVALLSGTLELLALPMAERLRVAHVVSTSLRQENGVFLAKPPVVHPFSSAKRTLGERLMRELGFDWPNVVAYGDSYHDLALLEAAGKPVVVRPDKRLSRVALDRGWEILDSLEIRRIGGRSSQPGGEGWVRGDGGRNLDHDGSV